MTGMDPRPLTPRERAVLDALLAAGGPGVAPLRRQAAQVSVVGGCGCGCPSVDFRPDGGRGMTVRVNAGVRGSHDGLFLYTVEDPQQGEVLGGIEWVGVEGADPGELPPPDLLDIHPAVAGA